MRMRSTHQYSFVLSRVSRDYREASVGIRFLSGLCGRSLDGPQSNCHRGRIIGASYVPLLCNPRGQSCCADDADGTHPQATSSREYLAFPDIELLAVNVVDF
jgi:hypothetical protein